MKKRIKIIYLILIVLVSACKKEASNINQADKTGLLYQVKYGSEITAEYTYNESNQILEDKTRVMYTKYNYKDGKLISFDFYIDPGIYSSNWEIANAAMNRTEWVNPTNTEKDMTRTYFYDGDGKMIKSMAKLNVCEYNYDNKNRIIRETSYSDNAKIGYTDYIYDDNNNLIKELQYWVFVTGNPELQTTTEYEFDNKHNPYKAFNVLMMPGLYTNTNNILKKTYRIYFEVDPSIDTLQITEDSYSYNSLDFPVSKNDKVTYIYY